MHLYIVDYLYVHLYICLILYFHLYICCTSTATGVGAASAASYQGSAAGNSTRGIFALGALCGVGSTTRNKYTYACCTSTATGVGAASANSSSGSAASWATCVNV